MKQILLTLLLFILVYHLDAQTPTLTETQMRNARASGYAIVAARNPGISFSIYVIAWDGVNSLESNANSQINGGWHAQAAIKGNFLNQAFSNSDFSQYSSVIVSQEEFDLYKTTGGPWAIVCSTLPPFSASLTTSSNGVGDGRVSTISGSQYSGAIQIKNHSGAGGSANRYLRLGMKDNNSVFSPVISINENQFVGIGTTDPDAKLAVKGHVHTQEVRVDMTGAMVPDYVFEKNYKLLTLSEIENYINQNRHLPEVPAATEMEANGVKLGEMNMLLLKKVEELTLYAIEQQKEINEQKKSIQNLLQKVKALEQGK